tara:strand:- start:11039 stop:11263 length:225 start_codon:yes stop_codon:yes gene_type:complete
MAVIIQNISSHDDMIGSNDYVVRINNQTIAYFGHVRSEGLATCLRKAADAVDAAEADADESRNGLAAALSAAAQ